MSDNNPTTIENLISDGLALENNLLCVLKECNVQLSEQQLSWIKAHCLPAQASKLTSLSGARGSGRTSVGLGMILNTLIFHDNSMTVIVAEKKSNHRCRALNFLKAFEAVYELPNNVVIDTSRNIRLWNGSSVVFCGRDELQKGQKFESVFIDLPNVTDLIQIDDVLQHFITRTSQMIVSLEP